MGKQIKRYCVIGLGNFGFHAACTLFENGNEVTVIDVDKDKVQRIMTRCTVPIIGDASDKQFLIDQGVVDMDAVVVATGENNDLTILITLLLKEVGVGRIVVKTKSEEHSRILKKVGATDVVFPEKDTAIRTAHALSSQNILEYIPLAQGYSISEITPPQSICGKSLMDLDLRKKFQVNVVAIKDTKTGNFNITPDPRNIITNEHALIIIGSSSNIEALLKSQ